MAILERWLSYKKTCIKRPRTKFGRSWRVLVFFFFSVVNVLKEIKVYLNKDLQFCVYWNQPRRLKMFSITFDFEYTYIKEVQYNCSAHGSAHLFIIAISSHGQRTEGATIFFQFSYSVTMINIIKNDL